MTRFRLPLDLQLFAGEKTEPATPKKREEARKKGQVARSGEIPKAFLLLICFVFLFFYGSTMKNQMQGVFKSIFENYLLMNLTVDSIENMLGRLFIQGLLLVTPFFIIAIVVGILGNTLQFGLMFNTSNLGMKFSKLNPISGIKNLFNLRSAVELVKSIIKVSLVGIVVYSSVWGEKDQILNLGHVPLESVLGYVANLVLWLGIKIGAVLILLALADYYYQKYEHEKSLKMSKQDIKDEIKKAEGDPLVRGKIREKQRKMAIQRMMQEVPKADVVITNPTHFAVAIKYESGGMEAPVVIAKGADFVALKIKQVAIGNGVTVMENKPLARALYAQVEIGQPIPQDLFQAVAEVLAYVYKLQGRTAGGQGAGKR